MNVILHNSASKFGNAAEITRWHLARGFNTIGYHYVILNGWVGNNKYHNRFDGTIETGRPIDDDKYFEYDELGAHTLGHNNCVGICLIGNGDKFTKRQLRSLRALLMMLKSQFDNIDVYQHSDFDPVNKPHCAGFTVEQMLEFNGTTISSTDVPGIAKSPITLRLGEK